MKELDRGDRVYLLLSTNLLSPWSTTQNKPNKTLKGVCISGFLEMTCEIPGGAVQEGPRRAPSPGRTADVAAAGQNIISV